MVFKAEDTETKKRVAVKVLPTDRASDPTILRAFMHEVRAAAKVASPEPGPRARHRLLAGHALRRLRVRPRPDARQVRRREGAARPARRGADHRPGGGRAIRAHQVGLIHRDVKPGNIAAPAGAPRQADRPGLTHMLENPWARVTKRINTKEYAEEIAHIAPEQAWGCEMDARSDVYSLGSTFYYLLTGEVPFPGTGPGDDGRAADSRRAVAGGAPRRASRGRSTRSSSRWARRTRTCATHRPARSWPRCTRGCRSNSGRRWVSPQQRRQLA